MRAIAGLASAATLTGKFEYVKMITALESEDALNRKENSVLTAVIIAGITGLMFNLSPGCGVEPKKTQVIDLPSNCGSLNPGDTIAARCPDGFSGDRVQVCKSDGSLEDVVNQCKQIDEECKTGAKVTFEEIEPIIAAQCASCHSAPQRFDDYEVAKSLAAEFVRRVNLSSDNRERMPPSPNPELSRKEKDAIEKWIGDGLLRRCDDDDAAATSIDLDYIESAILIDLNRIDSDDRVFTRYLVSAQRFNADAQSREAGQAINKGLNSLSNSENLQNASAIDDNDTVWRIDLRSYGLNQADWKSIEDADRLKIESFTTKGGLIKTLTGTCRSFMPHDNFLDTTFRNSDLYYSLLRIPGTFDELMAQIGVDFAGDLLPDANGEIDALAVGFNGSRISNGKNRLLVRHQSKNENFDYVWNTFDPIELGGVPQRNLFQFPLLAQTGSLKIFEFAAGETIYGLPNGLQAYALFDAAGVRQNVAPVNIVRDTDSPISSEIRNANSCTRCHNAGIIPARDRIRGHVVANASNFDIADVEIVKQLYLDDRSNSAQFAADNARFGDALRVIGVSATPDPIARETDQFLQDWTAEQAADFLWLEDSEFKACINGSATARAQVGQLLDGGTVTYDQFVEILPILKIDCRLFQDGLGQ